MTIYIDHDYRCHVQNDGTMTAIETDFFDGKCTAFIEGYRFVPAGQVWTNQNGIIYVGEMIVPWKPSSELDKAQRVYEQAQLTDMKAALKLLGVSVDE